jgi:hypothetical protein
MVDADMELLSRETPKKTPRQIAVAQVSSLWGNGAPRLPVLPHDEWRRIRIGHRVS